MRGDPLNIHRQGRSSETFAGALLLTNCRERLKFVLEFNVPIRIKLFMYAFYVEGITFAEGHDNRLVSYFRGCVGDAEPDSLFFRESVEAHLKRVTM